MGLLPGLFELVLATVSVAYASVTPPAIPMVFAEGDPYKIGFTIVSYTIVLVPSFSSLILGVCVPPQGAAFKTQILTALHNDTFYNSIMLPYYHTPKGAALYQNMFFAANRSFPQYVDELQGMANAVGVTLEEVSVVARD